MPSRRASWLVGLKMVSKCRALICLYYSDIPTGSVHHRVDQPEVKLLWGMELMRMAHGVSIFLKWPHQRSKVRGQIAFINTLWPPNLVGRIPERSVMHCLGLKSFRGQLGPTCSGMPYGNQLVGRSLDQSVVQWWVMQESAGVKSLRNALRLPNLIWKNLDWSIVHWWGQRSSRGQIA